MIWGKTRGRRCKACGGAEEGGARGDTEQRKGEKMQRMGDGRENRERREMHIVEGRRAVGCGGKKEDMREGGGKEEGRAPATPSDGRRRGREGKGGARKGKEAGGGNEASANSSSAGEGGLEKEEARGGEKRWGDAHVLVAAAAAAGHFRLLAAAADATCRCLLAVQPTLMLLFSAVFTLSSP